MPPAPDTPAAPLDVHVVAHTHWDREWYLPLGRFRQRLVALVDELLDDPPAPGASFLLDGQAIVVEDYLTVRPERRAELSSLLRDGRLEAGPWYVLADELIPGGEALVRNLLAGRRALRALRAAAPPVLYCPDSFGHPAILPSLAAGFGLPAILLWRGYGGARWPAGDAAWWRGPDGDRVLLLHLPPSGYELGANLPRDAAAAAARWAELRQVLAPRSRLGVVIVPNGADHHARQPAQAAALDALARAALPDRVLGSSLGSFVEAALARAGDAALPTVAGELRDSYGYAWTLQGTFATRTAQKRTNAIAERLLVRDAEPWAAIASARGGRSRRPLVDAAWKALLECHPHDTLCGCSVDDVATAADVRWRDAIAQASGVRDDALEELTGHDAAAAREARGSWRPVHLVRNRAARTRAGVAQLTVDTFVGDVGVGPSSAGQRLDVGPRLPPHGIQGPHQVLGERLVHARTESRRHYPDDDLVVRRTMLVAVGPVPGYGLAPLDADAAVPPEWWSDAPAVTADAGTRSISNGLLSLAAGEDGDVTLTLPDGRQVERLVAIERRRDVGDLYTPSLREPGPLPRVAEAAVTESGPLRAALRLAWQVPALEGSAATDISATLSLTAGEPFLRVDVEGEHRGADERIRVLLRTGAADSRVWADAAFGPVRRAAIEVADWEAAIESPPPTAPLHRYVSLFGAGGGATIFSDGLAEYEAMADGTVAVTLVRAVAELSRPDLPERPGNAGWPVPTPGAQSPGPFAAALALYLHRGTRDLRTIDDIERVADDVLLPLSGSTRRSALRVPDPLHGLALVGDGLAFSACKESEDGAWTVLRCVNLTTDERRAVWHVGWPVREARTARLDETPLDALRVEANGRHGESVAGELSRQADLPPNRDSHRVAFDAPAGAIVTVLVR